MKKVKYFFLKFFCFVFFLAFVCQAILLLLNLLDTWHTNAYQTELISMKTVGQYMGLNDGLKDINKDYRGWLTVYGTDINNPVVQSTDNTEYLSLDFNKQKKKSGTLFLDKNTDNKKGGNRIIYGHKMRDDTMFGQLDRFTNKDFFDQNGIISFKDEFEETYYEVFSVLVVDGYHNSENFIDFTQWLNDIPISSKKEMLNILKQKSSFFKEDFFSEKDEFLFLITCDYTKQDGRLVIVAKKI